MQMRDAQDRMIAAVEETRNELRVLQDVARHADAASRHEERDLNAVTTLRSYPQLVHEYLAFPDFARRDYEAALSDYRCARDRLLNPFKPCAS